MFWETFVYNGSTLPYNPNKPRNVVPYLNGLDNIECRNIQQEKAMNVELFLVNIEMDNNLGNIIRSSNIFPVKTVNLFGRKNFDKRACVGSHFTSVFRQIHTIEEIKPFFETFDYVIALDNNQEFNKPIYQLQNFDFRPYKGKKILVVIGHEGLGIPDYILKECDFLIEIEQFGSTRSLNVAVASGILLYEMKKVL